MKLRYDDEKHAYWLDGVRAKGVTTVAKIPDDTYNLERWGMRQVAIGLTLDPHLREMVAAHFDDRDTLNSVCEKAKEKAGAHQSAERGTAIHRITERHDAGGRIIPTELSEWTVQTWQELLDAYGLEVVPEYRERIVVFPEDRICGRMDGIFRRKKDGALMVGDLKTGERAVKYPHSIAVQMGIYANAPLMAGPLPPEGGQTEEFEPLPEGLDLRRALIIHMPVEGEPIIVNVDIERGWQTFDRIIRPTLAWRKLDDLVSPAPKIDPPVANTAAPAGRPSLQEVRDSMPKLTTVPDTPPAWSVDEGHAIDDDELNKLRAEFMASGHVKRINGWLSEASKAQRGFNVADHKTARRCQIIRAAIDWSAHDDDVVRAALHLVWGEEIQPAFTIGQVLGSLDLDQATRLRLLARQLDEGTAALRFSDGGAVIEMPQPAA